MKELREFDIAITRLGNKKHLYTWNVGDKFFKNFPGTPVEKANFIVSLELDHSDTMMQLYFRIDGMLELICDRSLEPFDFKFDNERKLILKFGEEPEILTDEIEIINRDEQVINVAQYIYEFVCLTIPMKKLHPKFNLTEDEEESEGIIIYTSEDEKKEEVKEDEIIDPRWEALKKIKKENK